MALTKSTAVVLAAGTSVAAGGTQSSAWIDVRTAYAASILARVTNGGTGPTAGAQVRINLSTDNGTTIYASIMLAQCGIVASASYPFEFPLKEDTMYVQVVVTGNTGQAVTAQADVTQVTAL